MQTILYIVDAHPTLARFSRLTRCPYKVNIRINDIMSLERRNISFILFAQSQPICLFIYLFHLLYCVSIREGKLSLYCCLAVIYQLIYLHVG